MFEGLILGAIWHAVTAFFFQFWMWIVGAAVAILGWLFSPALRNWTIGLIAVAVILVGVYLYGYNSHHPVVMNHVTTHACDEFRKVLVKGPATDKAINIFMRKGLCV